MRVLCLFALLQSGACLFLQDPELVEKPKTALKNPGHPRYALVGDQKDVEVIWQRPRGPPVGAFLYLHGCGNRALDMWSTKGHDGHEFKACNNTKKGYCAGLPMEGLMKDAARNRGYIVIAVQGGASSNRGCFHPEDVPRIKAAIKHVYVVEKLEETPLIMTGMSAGGRVIGELATSGGGGAGVPMKCAAVQVAELNAKMGWAWPNDLPIAMYHMPKDGLTEALIKKNADALHKKKVPFKNQEVWPLPITEEYLMAGGHGLNKTTAQAAMDAFKKADLLQPDGMLKLDPYNPKPKTRWMKAIEAAGGEQLKWDIGGFAQQSPVTKLMERSWASHALVGDKTNEIIDFCEKEGAAKEAKAAAAKLKESKQEEAMTEQPAEPAAAKKGKSGKAKAKAKNHKK